MYSYVPDNANTEDAISDLETALSLFGLLTPTYFGEIAEPPSFSSDRFIIGDTINAACDYIASAKKILETELKRAVTDRKEKSQHPTE